MDERLGFIHEKLDIKILILFILRRLPGSVSRETLQDLVQCDGGIGYFDFSDCLSEMTDNGLVLEDEDGYRISDKGAFNCEQVESSLPYSVRKKAEKLLASEAERLRRLAMITAKHETGEGGCTVTLAMSDGKGEIIHMDFLCSGEEQAKRIERNFKHNAEEIYGKIVSMLDE